MSAVDACDGSFGSRWNGHRPFLRCEATPRRRCVVGSCARVSARQPPLQNGGPEMNATTYGLDVAKRVFQMYWVDAQTGEIANRRFGRDELIRFLAQRPAGQVALEACGSGHWWARKIKALGHEVVLLHAKFI